MKSKAFKVYERDVERVSEETGILSKGEEKRLAILVQNGDEKAKKEMIEANLRLVFFVAKKRSFNNDEFEIFVSAGNEGLIRAVEKFDPSLGYRFSTYACIWIESKISNIKVRDSYHGGSDDAYLFFKSNKLREEFTSKNGFPIKEDDLADMLEISLDKLKAITERGNVKIDSMNSESREDGETFNLEERIADEKEHMDETILKKEIKDIAHVILRNCVNLTPKERFTLIHYFGIGLHQGYTLSDISKIMKVSSERVRQLFDKAMRKVKYTVFNHNITSNSCVRRGLSEKNRGFSRLDI